MNQLRSQLRSNPDCNESEGKAGLAFPLVRPGALGGTRTPNLLIRSPRLSISPAVLRAHYQRIDRTGSLTIGIDKDMRCGQRCGQVGR